MYTGAYRNQVEENYSRLQYNLGFKGLDSPPKEQSELERQLNLFNSIPSSGFYNTVLDDSVPSEVYEMRHGKSRRKRTDGKIKWRSKKALHGTKPCHGKRG